MKKKRKNRKMRKKPRPTIKKRVTIVDAKDVVAHPEKDEEASILHKASMECVDKALISRDEGDIEKATGHFLVAYQKEQEAASKFKYREESEPTRSILYRSAASLALECGRTRESERLVSMALAGNPPEEIAKELRDILENVHFQRHLELKGIKLQTDTFQFSMWGKNVGYGVALSEEFTGRVNDIEKLVYRTAERLLEKPYRDAGRKKKKLEEQLNLYISVPRAASFAVTFKLGSSKQMELPGANLPEEVIDELMDCFELFNKSKVIELNEKIEDDAYRRNFVALAKKIAPDGEDIEAVGFTRRRRGKEETTVLSTPKDRIEVGIPVSCEDKEPSRLEVESIEIQGTLKMADARKESFIDIVDRNGNDHKIMVPAGMMADIVRPMFDKEVFVKGVKIHGQIELEDIEEVSESQEEGGE